VSARREWVGAEVEKKTVREREKRERERERETGRTGAREDG
jgi:hypothetical protein